MILHSRVVYTEYFGGMELSVLEKLRRELEARQFEEWVLLFFWLLEQDVAEHESIEEIDREYYYDMAYWRYRDWVEEWLLLFMSGANTEEADKEIGQPFVSNDDVKYSDADIRRLMDSLDSQIRQKTKDIVDVTVDHPEDEYFTSEARASVISANETNFIGNYKQLEDARRQGFTLKQWKTKKDFRVRHTHIAVDDKVLGLDEYFNVGSARMLYPLDQSTGNHPEEVVNCRCVLKFI